LRLFFKAMLSAAVVADGSDIVPGASKVYLNILMVMPKVGAT
jgi:hypothetical protein